MKNKTFDFKKAFARAAAKHEAWVNGELVPAPDQFKFELPFRVGVGEFRGNRNRVRYNPLGGRAYSYNWCFVRRFKGKTVFNSYRWSTTTSGHQAKIRRLLDQLGVKIHFEANLGSGFNLDTLYHQLYTLEIEQARPRAKSRARAISEVKRQIKTARALGLKLHATLKSIKQGCQDHEAWRLRDLADRAEARRQRRAELKEIEAAPVDKLDARILFNAGHSHYKTVARRLPVRMALEKLAPEILPDSVEFTLSNMGTEEFPALFVKLKMPHGESIIEPVTANDAAQAVQFLYALDRRVQDDDGFKATMEVE